MKIAPENSPSKCVPQLSTSSNTNRMVRVNLTVLPSEILEHILSMCSPKEQNCFRNVCQRFREVHRDFVIHRYKVVCKRIRSKSSSPQRRNRIEVVWRLLRDVYGSFLRNDYLQVSFQSVVIELFGSLHSAPMSTDLIEVLSKFFDDAEQMLSKQSFNVSFIVSLLSLLHRFSKVSKYSQRNECNRIHFKYDVYDIWYLIIWSGDGRLLSHPNESQKILILLTILLIDEKFQQKFYETDDFGSRTIIYGNTTGRSNRFKCSVTFEIDISGDASIIDYLAKNDTFTNHEILLDTNNLTDVDIRFKCREASRLDDGQYHSMRF